MKFVLPAILLASAGAWAKGFVDDCEDILMWDLGKGDDRDFVLEASCGHDKKRVILALDMCIANQGGKLVFRNHGWMSSTCTDCQAEETSSGFYVACRCKDFNGKWTDINENNISGATGWLNLNDVFVYENGGFNCHFDWT